MINAIKISSNYVNVWFDLSMHSYLDTIYLPNYYYLIEFTITKKI